jgi:hypothetical protein
MKGGQISTKAGQFLPGQFSEIQISTSTSGKNRLLRDLAAYARKYYRKNLTPQKTPTQNGLFIWFPALFPVQSPD